MVIFHLEHHSSIIVYFLRHTEMGKLHMKHGFKPVESMAFLVIFFGLKDLTNIIKRYTFLRRGGKYLLQE